MREHHWQDARLKKALENAPDKDQKPSAQVRDHILNAAQQSVEKTLSQATPAPWWHTLTCLFKPKTLSMPWSAAWGSALLVICVGTLWLFQDHHQAFDTAPAVHFPQEPIAASTTDEKQDFFTGADMGIYGSVQQSEAEVLATQKQDAPVNLEQYTINSEFSRDLFLAEQGTEVMRGRFEENDTRTLNIGANTDLEMKGHTGLATPERSASKPMTTSTPAVAMPAAPSTTAKPVQERLPNSAILLSENKSDIHTRQQTVEVPRVEETRPSLASLASIPAATLPPAPTATPASLQAAGNVSFSLKQLEQQDSLMMDVDAAVSRTTVGNTPITPFLSQEADVSLDRSIASMGNDDLPQSPLYRGENLNLLDVTGTMRADEAPTENIAPVDASIMASGGSHVRDLTGETMNQQSEHIQLKRLKKKR